ADGGDKRIEILRRRRWRVTCLSHLKLSSSVDRACRRENDEKARADCAGPLSRDGACARFPTAFCDRTGQQGPFEFLKSSPATKIPPTDFDCRRPSPTNESWVVIPPPQAHQRGLELARDLRVGH